MCKFYRPTQVGLAFELARAVVGPKKDMFDVVSGNRMLNIQLADASEYSLDSMVDQILDADVVREWEAGRAVWDWEINTAIQEKQ